MKIKILIFSALFLSLLIQARAQEGHLPWYWDSRSGDFIVKGAITYDPVNYYELSPVNVKGKEKKYYWIVGSIKINKVLFIKKDSQYFESYQQFLKNTDKEHPVLIPALPRWRALDDDSNTFKLMPMLGLDIPKEPTIYNLSQINIFPILDLKLDSVVQKEDVKEALDLIGKRTNNYLVDAVLK